MINWQIIIQQIEILQEKYEKIEENIHKGVTLWGAGQYGQMSLEYLQKSNYTVNRFIDVSPQKQGTMLKGVAVTSPPIKNGEVVLVTARHIAKEITSSFKDETLIMPFDTWFVVKNHERFYQLRENLSDERSKEVLDYLLMAMLTGDMKKYCVLAYDDQQYFCLPQFKYTGNESFLDAGSYVGDTIEKFIFFQNGSFKHIYAFEPGLKQFRALEKRIERLLEEWALDNNCFTLYNGGLADKTMTATVQTGTLLQSNTLAYESAVTNEEKVKVFSIDDLSLAITFLKADIEGSENLMLQGAVKTIMKCRPKMALCVYHRPDDIFTIIDFVKKLNLGYSFSLRHHSSIFMETTLYCF